MNATTEYVNISTAVIQKSLMSVDAWNFHVSWVLQCAIISYTPVWTHFRWQHQPAVLPIVELICTSASCCMSFIPTGAIRKTSRPRGAVCGAQWVDLERRQCVRVHVCLKQWGGGKGLWPRPTQWSTCYDLCRTNTHRQIHRVWDRVAWWCWWLMKKMFWMKSAISLFSN